MDEFMIKTRMLVRELKNNEETITNQNAYKKDSKITARQEFILKEFIRLLTKHYKKFHDISFYAEKLNISPHYLSLIVKRSTGYTINSLINEILFSEARILLYQNKDTIQQIADHLNFSDQSSFGKFFKRKSGLTPSEFRKYSIK